MMVDIDLTLKELIRDCSEVAVKIDEIHDDTNLLEEYGYNSIQTIKLIFEIEKKLNIVIDDELLDRSLVIKYSNLEQCVKSLVSYKKNEN